MHLNLGGLKWGRKSNELGLVSSDAKGQAMIVFHFSYTRLFLPLSATLITDKVAEL